MLGKFFSKKSRGFTLVELLIVVAIIGVLSTLGVPTFRRMIQKSKKSEAKVNLGALFTAESAFQAEYNVYGNNLAKLGFEIDGRPQNLTYKVGFFDAACAGPTAAEPSASSQQTALNSAYPAYYNSYNATAAWAGYNGFNSGCNVAVGAPVNGMTTFNVNTTGTAFLASANGVISPKVSDRSNPTATDVDVWTMDDGRALVNTNDGVR